MAGQRNQVLSAEAIRESANFSQTSYQSSGFASLKKGVKQVSKLATERPSIMHTSFQVASPRQYHNSSALGSDQAPFDHTENLVVTSLPSVVGVNQGLHAQNLQPPPAKVKNVPPKQVNSQFLMYQHQPYHQLHIRVKRQAVIVPV